MEHKNVTEPYLARFVGDIACVALSPDFYHTLFTAEVMLGDALAFEQRYDILIANHMEFELGLVRTSLMLQTGISLESYSPVSTMMLEINRQLLNLMSAAKAHLDHTVQDFRGIDVSPPFKDQFKMLTAAAYDAEFDYRFMEALRNHTQHKAMPVHLLFGGGSRIDSLHWAESLIPCTVKANLHAAGGFKPRILEEMQERVNLRATTRHYVQALSRLHMTLRSVVHPYMEECRRVIGEALQRCREKTGHTSNSLLVYAGPADG